MAHSLDPLMRPQSVAVIGASDEPARIGGRPVYSMLEGKFHGRLYPVNPSRETVQGLKAYASIKNVPEVVDSVVVSVPASDHLQVVEVSTSGHGYRRRNSAWTTEELRVHTVVDRDLALLALPHIR